MAFYRIMKKCKDSPFPRYKIRNSKSLSTASNLSPSRCKLVHSSKRWFFRFSGIGIEKGKEKLKEGRMHSEPVGPQKGFRSLTSSSPTSHSHQWQWQSSPQLRTPEELCGDQSHMAEGSSHFHHLQSELFGTCSPSSLIFLSLWEEENCRFLLREFFPRSV